MGDLDRGRARARPRRSTCTATSTPPPARRTACSGWPRCAWPRATARRRERLLQRALPLARWSVISMHLLQRIYGTMIAAAPDRGRRARVVDQAEATLGETDHCLFCDVMLAVPAAIACADVGDLDDARRHLAPPRSPPPGGRAPPGRRAPSGGAGPRRAGRGRPRQLRGALGARGRTLRAGRSHPGCGSLPGVRGRCDQRLSETESACRLCFVIQANASDSDVVLIMMVHVPPLEAGPTSTPGRTLMRRPPRTAAGALAAALAFGAGSPVAAAAGHIDPAKPGHVKVQKSDKGSQKPAAAPRDLARTEARLVKGGEGEPHRPHRGPRRRRAGQRGGRPGRPHRAGDGSSVQAPASALDLRSVRKAVKDIRPQNYDKVINDLRHAARLAAAITEARAALEGEPAAPVLELEVAQAALDAAVAKALLITASSSKDELRAVKADLQAAQTTFGIVRDHLDGLSDDGSDDESQEEPVEDEPVVDPVLP